MVSEHSLPASQVFVKCFEIMYADHNILMQIFVSVEEKS